MTESSEYRITRKGEGRSSMSLLLHTGCTVNQGITAPSGPIDIYQNIHLHVLYASVSAFTHVFSN